MHIYIYFIIIFFSTIKFVTPFNFVAEAAAIHCRDSLREHDLTSGSMYYLLNEKDKSFYLYSSLTN